jgi:phosphatidylglycerophosphatase A
VNSAPSEAPAESSTEPDTPAPARGRPTLAVWIATAGGIGFGPWAPGTWGALLAAVLFVLLLSKLGFAAYLAVVVGVSAVGVWASGAAEPWFGKHDDGRIVIDEVAGQLITLAPLVGLRDVPLGRLALPEAWLAPGSAWTGGIDAYLLLVVTGFVAFRWFDIRKPGRVRWAEERFPGGMGVMADDIVAGVMGAVVVMVPAYFLLVRVVSLLGSGGGAA